MLEEKMHEHRKLYVKYSREIFTPLSQLEILILETFQAILQQNGTAVTSITL